MLIGKTHFGVEQVVDTLARIRPAAGMPREGGAAMNRQKVTADPVHYDWLTKQASPPSRIGQGILRAYWVGGVICMLGQAAADVGTKLLKMTTQDGYCLAAIVLVFLTALLTDLVEHAMINSRRVWTATICPE